MKLCSVEDREELSSLISEKALSFEQMSDAIWEFAELRFTEYRSSALQKDYLLSEGFKISSPVGNLETAFVAEYGFGKPVIAVLGEFDALLGLSQKAGITERQEEVPGGNGHGCGHHLLGTAAVEAAVAVRHWMERNSVSGTVRYYACPGEERGCGKVFMIQAGAFQDVDAALSWHPDSLSFRFDSSRASCSAVFSFHGLSAHAANDAHLGRSALDAAELSNIGVNFLREHIPPGCSIQYAFKNAGNPETNIIPDYAAVEYTVRALSKKDVEAVFQRLTEVASGAAMMTGTNFEQSVISSAYSDILRNDTLLELLRCSEECFSDSGFTPEDFQQAKRFSSGSDTALETESSFPIDTLRASADFGDVTRVIPGAAFALTCFAARTALHSWSAVAQGKTDYAHKGMHRAARILACASASLFRNPDLLLQARHEFERRTEGQPYSSLLLNNKTESTST